jgi:DNA-binding transcriptional ArsR family regulator
MQRGPGADADDVSEGGSHVPQARRGTYLQVSESLRQKIETGEITEVLPSQAVLMSVYSVSRSTIERALAALKAEGVIESVQGAGWFVAGTGDRRPLVEKVTDLLRADGGQGRRLLPHREGAVRAVQSVPDGRPFRHRADGAREACVTLVKAAQTTDKHSLGIRLLTDLRDHVLIGVDKLPTIAILDRLNALDDAPWADLDGKPLDNRRLARMLGEYMTADNTPIRSRNIRTAGGVLKGFHAEDLADAWARYCPPPPQDSATSATPLQPSSEPLNL